MIKLVIIAVFLAAAYSNDEDQGDDTKIKCYGKAAEGDALEEKECAAATGCAKPIFTILDGIKDYPDYGCAPCTGDKSANCETCKTGGCNAKLVAGEDFMCKNYAWDEDSTSYKAGDTDTTCKTLKDSETKNECNKPKDDATKGTYVIADNGCGPCGDDAGNTKCEAIAGAVGVSALLLPLLAAIYTLF